MLTRTRESGLRLHGSGSKRNIYGCAILLSTQLCVRDIFLRFFLKFCSNTQGTQIQALSMQVETLSPFQQQTPYIRIADPRHFNADPDPVFHWNVDPDPTPTFSLLYGSGYCSLSELYFESSRLQGERPWPSTAQFWASEGRLYCGSGSSFSL